MRGNCIYFLFLKNIVVHVNMHRKIKIFLRLLRVFLHHRKLFFYSFINQKIFIDRQRCAIESAALMNPNRDVYVLFLSPVGFVLSDADSPVIAALKSYPNVHFRNLDIYQLSKNTPAEGWIKKDRIFLSENFLFHMSYYIRLVIIYKFGGAYFDLDLIVVKSLDDLPPNFAPQEQRADKEYRINNSVLGFESTDVGHQIAEMILRFDFEFRN